MLNTGSQMFQNCSGMTRRSLLQIVKAPVLGLGLADLLRFSRGRLSRQDPAAASH
ncbi:MAG: hypothetical protein U0936_18665 [Planctomycetaceae bacterium]